MGVQQPGPWAQSSFTLHPKKKEEEKPGIGALSSLVLGSQGLCTAGQGRPSSQVPAPGGV